MPSDYNAGTERRGRSREKLATLVKTRTETLSLYTELANQQPFEGDEVTREALQDFCQALIDYTPVIEVAGSIYPRIAQTTDRILRFNDRYEDVDLMSCDGEVLERLSADLSSLGETLAERIQLEDQVISAMAGQVH